MTAAGHPPAVPPLVSLTGQIEAHLERLILDGGIAAGTRLSEPEIAGWFRSSRAPVREALRRLEQSGLVAIEPRRGASVKAPTRDEVENMLSVREALEGMAARLAAERADDDDVARLRACVARLRKGAAQAGGEPRADFHEALLRAARNDALRQLMRGSMNMFRLLRALSSREEGRHGASAGEHLSILRAIEARDADSAEESARAHVRKVRAALLAALDRAAARRGDDRRPRVVPLRRERDRND